jgi:carboxyl-terminal processing protease
MFSKKLLKSLIILILGGVIGYNLALNKGVQIIIKDNNATQPNIINEKNPNLDLTSFWEAYNILKEKYFDASVFDAQKQIHGAIKGLLGSIDDPYTVYMNPDENKAFMTSLEGSFEGIGAELSVNNQGLVVVSALKNSPAEKAGLKAKDLIYKIEDELTSEMTLFDAIMKIRGQKGTYVKLIVLRENEKEPLELSIKRDTVDVPNVEYTEVAENIYHINMYQFGEDTVAEFQNIIQQLLLKNPKGIILDLRQNGGGYLEAAVDVLSEFVTKDQIAVNIKYRDEKQNSALLTKDIGRLNNIPLVILIDNGSASASEIVAGAIQDWQRGIIVGEKSFGKGSVQELYTLENGGSLRITVAHWFTPLGRSIQKEGISPDKIVSFTKEGFDENMDSQLDAAIKILQNEK